MAKATRRRFTAEYKLRVLGEAAACTEPGEIGALLRREGLYTSHLCLRRKQRRARELMGLAPARRGSVPKATNPLAAKVAALEKETRWLTARAERAEALVELQKKVSEILGVELTRHGETPDGGGRATTDEGRDRLGVCGPVRGAGELLPRAAPEGHEAPAPALRPSGSPTRGADAGVLGAQR